MLPRLTVCFTLVLCLLSAAHAGSEAAITLQSRHFMEQGATGQARWQPSVAFSAEFVANPNDTDQIVFAPFLRLDREDPSRTHADVRELYWSRLQDSWELSVGVRQVFWGVTEFHHLIDIINQTDLVENVDDEDRLGQPMVQLSLVRDWGIIDLFLLAGARERTFAGRDGRLRLPIKVDAGRAEFASGADNRRLDVAARWSHSFGGIDLGLHHFSGTARDPELVPVLAPGEPPRLRPRYHVIDQTGVDAQWLRGNLALKLEAFSRSGDAHRRYAAAVMGVEQTLVGVLGSAADVGLVAEYLFDERGDDAANTLFQDDVALGLRFTLNDFADSQALLGIIWDRDSEERIVSLEASRSVGAQWSLGVEARWFSGSRTVPADQPLRAVTDTAYRAGFLEQEDYVQIELTRYF